MKPWGRKVVESFEWSRSRQVLASSSRQAVTKRTRRRLILIDSSGSSRQAAESPSRDKRTTHPTAMRTRSTQSCDEPGIVSRRTSTKRLLPPATPTHPLIKHLPTPPSTRGRLHAARPTTDPRTDRTSARAQRHADHGSSPRHGRLPDLTRHITEENHAPIGWPPVSITAREGGGRDRPRPRGTRESPSNPPGYQAVGLASRRQPNS